MMHLADLHIGKSLGEFDLIEDQRYIFDELLDIADKQKVDVVVIAGDVFDKSVPSEAAVQLFDYLLRELAKRSVHTYMISGNHDSDERLNFGSSLFEKQHIYIKAKYNGMLEARCEQDEFGEVNLYLLPFVKASMVKHFFPDEKIDSYEAAVKTILAHAQIDTSKRNILVAHQFVAGTSEDPEFAGSEGLSVQTVGMVEKIGYDCLHAFDYVALGHIHASQKIGRQTVRYAGSPLKYSTDEWKQDKKVPIVTLGEKGKTKVEFVPLTPKRDLRRIKGKLKDLLKAANPDGEEDYMYVILTDEEVVNDAIGIVRQYYPNTVRLEYENSHTKQIGQISSEKPEQAKSFSQVIADFYQTIYGCEISEDERKMMMEAAKEVGICNEAD